MNAFLQVEHIEKWHDCFKTLDGVSLSLQKGEILTLLGPSGGGKTTLLRILAGLEYPDGGDLCLDGEDLLPVAPHERGIGLVFQDAALFPHLNVEANVAFGLRMAGVRKRDRRQRVRDMLALVGLSGMEGRRVDGLSGGERQRVALARSLAPAPKLLLLDEPLGALDRNLRERLARDLRSILKQQALTAVFVTHDQEEAFSLGDRVAVLLDGRLKAMDTPEGLSANPCSLAVARFLGETNVFTPETLPDKFRKLAGGYCGKGGVLIRPEGIGLGPCPEKRKPQEEKRGGRDFHVQAVVKERRFFGTFFRVDLELADGLCLTARMPLSLPPPHVGVPVGLHFAPGTFVALSEA
ncbi:ABC transporter ATP-binding protein [Desulfobotulus sp. H1]|uniref:ABC transporter ATP-binding protein n=1 Tax=Desulfobotulus pelophilus TaxID=2823377 RepID=A0ABT3NBR9_9BACT|nr:ABC transporter ATP-binding protein [Desulfobotulus pelophilus]MCW7754621.1 ABC transporter ATP-binding protein [Desulfobotulus pelophilus]